MAKVLIMALILTGLVGANILFYKLRLKLSCRERKEGKRVKIIETVNDGEDME